MARDTSLPFRYRVLYGVGQMPEGMKNIAFAVFVLFYYNHLLGLDAALAGLSIAIALCVDVVTDPIIGGLSDRTQSRMGRRHPFMFAGIIPMVASFYLLFVPPEGLSQMALFGWLTVFGVIVRVATTLFTVPHMAMGAELAEGYEERTLLVAWRQGFSAVGSLLVYALAFLVFFPDTKADAAPYPAFAMAVSGLMAVALCVSAFGTQGLVSRMRSVGTVQPSRSLTKIFDDIKEAMRSANARWYYAGSTLNYLMVGIDASLLLYVNAYIWEISGRALASVTMGLFIGFVLASRFTQILHARFGKRPVLMFATAWMAFFQLLPILLWLAGWMPAAGAASIVVLLSALRLIQGLGGVHSGNSSGSLLADLADEHELATGKRNEGVFFGAQLVTMKATSGIGKLVAGFALSFIAWPTLAQAEEYGVASDKVLWLALLYGPIAAMFSVAALVCYSHYKLDADAHSEIAAALRTKRA